VGNTTTPRTRAWNLYPPSSAKYVKFILHGGTSDVDPGTPTNIYFDNVKLSVSETDRFATPFAPGTVLVNANDSSANTNLASFTELKATIVGRRGRVVASYAFNSGTTINAVGTAFYRNGTIIGQQHNSSLTSLTTISSTIEVEAGDRLSVYGLGVAGQFCNVERFRLYSTHSLDEGFDVA
jgi:hypothetical protein